MAFTKSTVAVNNVRNLENQPKGKATEVKTAMDQYGIDDKEFINQHIDELESTSASENLGYVGDVPGSSTVKQALDFIYSQGSGSIPPDGSITRNKLAPDVRNVISNNSKGIATNSAVIDELLVAAGIESKLAPTSGKFYDYPGASGQLSQGEIDLTKAYCETVTQGTNTISVTNMNVNDFSDFEIGQEITLQDNVSSEKLTILLLSNPLITFSSDIVNEYVNGANVYRSNIKIEGDSYKFGGFNAEEEFDRTTPVQVVGQPYSTEGNGGRKINRLSNGWLISSNKTASFVYFQVDKQDGNGFVPLCNINSANLGDTPDVSIVSNGTIVHALVTSSATFVTDSFNFDATTITNVNIYSTRSNIDGGQSAIGNCSLTIAPNGDLHATWASKNATYPNSFNLRYSKSTDGGVTWDAPTQITSRNTIGSDEKSPTIVSMVNGQACIIHETIANGNFILAKTFNGVSWVNSLLYNGGAYAQSNPSADVLSDGTIGVVWESKDASDPSVFNISFAQSVDYGVTWSTREKLTSGNTLFQRRPSISRNVDDLFFIAWGGSTPSTGVLYASRLIEGNTGNWGAIQDLVEGLTNLDNFSTCSNFRDYSKPLTIYMNSAGSVDFTGKWTEGTELELTEVDIRINIVPLQEVSDIGSYLNVSNNVLNVEGKVSIVDSGNDESYTDLIDTRYPIDASNDEVASLLNSTLTEAEKVTLYYNITRSLVTDDVSVNSIIGGVS